MVTLEANTNNMGNEKPANKLKDKVSRLEKICKDASICGKIRLCHQDGLESKKCILSRSEMGYGTAGMICKVDGYERAYALYEAAKAKAEEMDIPVGTNDWFDCIRECLTGKLIDGKPVQVPFRPEGGKPVYIKETYEKQMRR